MLCHDPKSLLRRRGLILAALDAVARGVQAQTLASPQTADDKPRNQAVIGPSSASIQTLLTSRVDIGHDSVGYVAAIEDASGKRLINIGRSDSPDGWAMDGDTVFEIGSITKVFTALLLADMVLQGEVALSDPVAKYLPPQGQPRRFDGKLISLLDLVTHTSGLPRMPNNIELKDPGNPYADYSVAQLYAALSSMPALYYPGSQYQYSNLGFGLLGHVLALRAGRSYEELLVSRICAPLGLNDTRITLTSSMRQRLTPGHNASLQKVPNWDLPAVAGAGALRSTANDLLRFLDAGQGRVQTELAAAFASLLDVRRQTDTPREYAAAGWFVRTEHDDELVWKDGGTGGYSTFIGYSTHSGLAVVLLANTLSGFTTPRIGWHLLNLDYPLPALHSQITLDATKLDAYAGHYALTPSFVLTVTSRNGHLIVQATNQAEFEVFPESETRFFYREVDAQLTFDVGADGMATAVLLHQNGRDQRGMRMP